MKFIKVEKLTSFSTYQMMKRMDVHSSKFIKIYLMMQDQRIARLAFRMTRIGW